MLLVVVVVVVVVVVIAVVVFVGKWLAEFFAGIKVNQARIKYGSKEASLEAATTCRSNPAVGHSLGLQRKRETWIFILFHFTLLFRPNLTFLFGGSLFPGKGDGRRAPKINFFSL